MAQSPGIVRAFLEEPYTYVTLGFLLALLWNTFSSDFAGMYSILLVVDLVGFLLLKSKLNFNSVSGNSGQALLTAVVVFLIFSAGSWLVIQLTQGAANLSLNSMLGLWKESIIGSANPIWQDNRFVIFFVGTFIIPLIETKALIARMIEFLSKVFGTSLDLKDLKTWILIIVVSGIGVIYHWQAKGVGNGVALLMTFLFWATSCVLILKTRESESAVYLHMITNGAALLVTIL